LEKLDDNRMSFLEGKRILVTGGTGSLGQTLVRRLLTGELGRPAKITVYSRDEAKQHYMRLDYLHRAAATDDVIYQNSQDLLRFIIGDVRDFPALTKAVRDADVVFHAAAPEAGAVVRVFSVRSGSDKYCRRGQSCACDSRARSAGRESGRHLNGQGLQTDQRDGHDEGASGARSPRGESRMRDEFHVRPLRKRDRVARIHRSAFRRASAEGAGDDRHLAGDDSLSVESRSRGRHSLRGDPSR
jgi:hypothetical protein